MNLMNLQAPSDYTDTEQDEDLLGPDIHVIERDGLRVLRISRASWYRRVIHELVLGPGRIDFAMRDA